ncbi:ATP-binding cassette domain-containing protein [candidate division KSB1 bacterium]|nr:ATP-binding cassette domain-containing protein [candidate division KSB1 bacterium]
MKNGELLQTFRLCKRIKHVTAVDDLNLTVHRGDVFGFLGPNGAGKSTTIRLLLGLVKPTRGEVMLFGRLLKKARRLILSKIGALVEKPSFYEHLSARQNLAIILSFMGNNNLANIERVLSIVNLVERADDRVKTYSQGMKQRLGIAQALLGNPELVILDEPTTGLDPQGMKDIRNLIHRLAGEGMTIFLSSHLLHEVEQLCTKMAIIDKGKLIFQGNVEELRHREANRIRLKVDRLEDAASLLEEQPWIDSVDSNINEITVFIRYSSIPHMVRFLIDKGFKIYAVNPVQTLEDYFFSILEQGRSLKDTGN